VALGRDGKPPRLPPVVAETADEVRRMAAAKVMRERRLGR